MPRFAANLSMMFPEVELSQRFEAARKAGFRAVEYLRPYSDSVSDLQHYLKDAGVELILLNTPLGDRPGDRGVGALPGREADFRLCFDQALDYATQLGAGMVHVMAGIVPEGVSPDECERVFVANLRPVADVAKAQGIKLLLEPLNTRDVPGYLHTHTADTRRIIEAVGSDNVFLQYDFYHMQIMQGDLVETMQRNLDIIGHMQFSSLPGRNEPQHGEVNFEHVFAAIDASGYRGWLGCEYRPKGDTLEGLSWGKPYGLGV
ncbi:MAG TPA: TIM barrel protein [Dehalococcoidia bacterium]|nr:TIM barrel protein [Dehalococcoidia bacterium]